MFRFSVVCYCCRCYFLPPCLSPRCHRCHHRRSVYRPPFHAPPQKKKRSKSTTIKAVSMKEAGAVENKKKILYTESTVRTSIRDYSATHPQQSRKQYKGLPSVFQNSNSGNRIRSFPFSCRGCLLRPPEFYPYHHCPPSSFTSCTREWRVTGKALPYDDCVPFPRCLPENRNEKSELIS